MLTVIWETMSILTTSWDLRCGKFSDSCRLWYKHSFLTWNDETHSRTQTKTYETTQVTHLLIYIRRLLKTIFNFRKPKQSLHMSEPCQPREDIEKTSSYDIITEHEYQQVSTVRSCEIHSLKTDNYETFASTKASEQLPLPTSETTETYENLACNGSSNQSQLSALTTTQVYDNLPTHGIKQSTLLIPRSTSLASSDKQANRNRRPRVTAIWD